MKKFLPHICGLVLGWILLVAPLFADGPHTGIQGQAFVYFTSENMELPVVTSFNILNARTRHVVTRVRTDPQGRFQLSLHPGTYVLIPETVVLNAAFACTADAAPLEINVKSRRFTTANILYPREGLCTTTETQ